MKLNEIAQKTSKGTYAGVKLSKRTAQSLVDYMHDAGIPNMLDKNDLHTTLLYSRRACPNYKPDTKARYKGTPIGFDVWDNVIEGGAKEKCLVLKVDCPSLVARHKQLMTEHNATYDYPEYTPHITLSYNIGNLKPEKFPDITKFLDTIELQNEYSKDLDLDWQPG